MFAKYLLFFFHANNSFSLQIIRIVEYFLFRPFMLDDFHNYEKHFTVMNYRPGSVLKQVCLDGLSEIVKQLLWSFSHTHENKKLHVIANCLESLYILLMNCDVLICFCIVQAIMLFHASYSVRKYAVSSNVF